MSERVAGQAPELAVEGRIATVTLRRPGVANRLELSDLDAFHGAIARVNAVPEVMVLRVRAQGRHFCSGFNIGQMDGEGGGAEAGARFEALAAALEQARPVTIAELHGGVYGGATDLALACDFRVGVHGMVLRMPAARIGLHYYPSGLRRYVSRLGVSAAKRLFLLAETLSADELQRIGYLDRCVAAEHLDAEVQQIVDALLAGAPLALRGMKTSLDEIARGDFDLARLREREAICAASEDLREGQAALAQKRKPDFQGR
jgi:enoyl-CoA hydratase